MANKQYWIFSGKVYFGDESEALVSVNIPLATTKSIAKYHPRERQRKLTEAIRLALPFMRFAKFRIENFRVRENIKTCGADIFVAWRHLGLPIKMWNAEPHPKAKDKYVWIQLGCPKGYWFMALTEHEYNRAVNRAMKNTEDRDRYVEMLNNERRP